MDRTRTLRNVAIIVAIAAVVRFVPGGGRTASAFESALWCAFGLGFAYLGLRMYRERRSWLDALGDRHRTLLYLSAGLILLLWAGRTRLWSESFGELVWFLLAAFVVWALMEVYRHSRSY